MKLFINIVQVYMIIIPFLLWKYVRLNYEVKPHTYFDESILLCISNLITSLSVIFFFNYFFFVDEPEFFISIEWSVFLIFLILFIVTQSYYRAPLDLDPIVNAERRILIKINGFSLSMMGLVVLYHTLYEHQFTFYHFNEFMK